MINNDSNILSKRIQKEVQEQEKIEKTLKEQYSIFHSIIDNTDAIIFSLDTQYRYTSFNNVHASVMNAIYGVEIEIGGSLLDYMTVVEDQEKAKRNLDRALAGESCTEEAFSGEELLSRHYFKVSHSPVITEEGSIIGVAVIAQDMTERKHAEETIKRSEERLQQLLSSVTDYIYKVTIEDGIVTETQHGDGCKSITGYTDKEFAKDKFLWFNIVHDDDKELVKNQIETLLIKHEAVSIEHRIRHKNGTVRWVRNTPVLHFTPEGVLFGYDGLISNITDRKLAEIALRESEERYRVVSTLSGHLVYERAMSDNNIAWGGAIKKVTGFTANEYADVNFEKWLEFIHPSDREKTLALFEEAMEHIKPFYAEYRYLNKNKEYIWIEDVSFILGDKFKKVKVVGVMKDITQRKTLERHILNSVIETEERERIHFSQELHDGIGPLLSAAKMYVQWLTMPNANAKQSEIIMDIEKLLDESSRTIREISFKLNPHILQNFGIAEAIKAYTEKVKESSPVIIELNTKNLCRFDEKVEIIAYRVLCESINNTIKHANASKIEIDLQCQNDMFLAEYSDNGRGFDVDKVLSSHKGIGLLNMQSRLKSINGVMSVTSRPGNGTTIKFHFRTLNN
jgi:PAS domain S-box-containing protein